eukprot:7237167-Prymnesium_polylepis.2
MHRMSVAWWSVHCILRSSVEWAHTRRIWSETVCTESAPTALPPLTASSRAAERAIVPRRLLRSRYSSSYVGWTIALYMPSRTRLARSPGGRHLTKMHTVLLPSGDPAWRPNRIAAWNMAISTHP